ncbi:hypothetical protein T01_3709 [Trichinella spiralis]|uniref:Uncharacterized protein n=1 Tax=Trichinella spiralis TaxID=6334 RepID=A0A0V1BZK0_TRISP|nr:hypothetical protein T01_3709 [Trichinella spiralis]
MSLLCAILQGQFSAKEIQKLRLIIFPSVLSMKASQKCVQGESHWLGENFFSNLVNKTRPCSIALVIPQWSSLIGGEPANWNNLYF